MHATASPSTSSSPIRGTPRGASAASAARWNCCPTGVAKPDASGRSRQRLVQPERVLERRDELFQIARDLERDLAELPSCLRRRRCRFRRFETSWRGTPRPTGLEVEHGRLRARHQPEALGAGSGGEAAGLRQPEEVGEVGAGACRALDEQLHGRRMGAVRHQDVGERGGVLAEEARDPQPAPVLDEQRQGAGEPVSLARDVDGEAVPAGMVAPPLEQPAVQQERARPRHRRHQRVPLGPEWRTRAGR